MISQFKEEDEEKNRVFKRILVALPLFSALPFVPTLVASASSLQMRLIGTLGISSLLCTVYVILSADTTHATGNPVPPTSGQQTPLRRYIDYLNGGLSFLVGLNAFYFKGKKGVDDGFWLLCTTG